MSRDASYAPNLHPAARIERPRLSGRARLARAASLAALGLPLAALAGCTDEDVPGPTTPPMYEDPPELAPDGDGVRELHFGPSAVEIDGRRYCLRAYNGLPVGPTIRVPRGENRKVRVNLSNDFVNSDFREAQTLGGTGRKSCHDFNVTNLHGHGLHVQPNHATDDPADPCKGNGCAPDQRYYGDHVLDGHERRVHLPGGLSARRSCVPVREDGDRFLSRAPPAEPRALRALIPPRSALRETASGARGTARSTYPLLRSCGKLRDLGSLDPGRRAPGTPRGKGPEQDHERPSAAPALTDIPVLVGADHTPEIHLDPALPKYEISDSRVIRALEYWLRRLNPSTRACKLIGSAHSAAPYLRWRRESPGGKYVKRGT